MRLVEVIGEHVVQAQLMRVSRATALQHTEAQVLSEYIPKLTRQ